MFLWVSVRVIIQIKLRGTKTFQDLSKIQTINQSKRFGAISFSKIFNWATKTSTQSIKSNNELRVDKSSKYIFNKFQFGHRTNLIYPYTNPNKLSTDLVWLTFIAFKVISHPIMVLWHHGTDTGEIAFTHQSLRVKYVAVFH